MSASALLDELRSRGVEVWAVGDRLRYKPRSAVDHKLRDRLAAYKPDLLRILEPDALLADSSVSVAVFHSNALDRDFVLARDGDALKALRDEDRGLPVLFYADCAHTSALGLDGLRALLDSREVFGPTVALAVRGASR